MREKITDLIITDIEGLYTVPSPKGRKEWIENRPNYGLCFCTEGQITYTHKGVQYVSDRDHAIILPQGQSYMLYGDKTGSFPLINFTCLDMLCDTHMLIPIDNLDAYLKDYELMRALSFFDGNKMKLLSLFYDMLHRLFTASSSSLLSPALKYIESNYPKPGLTNGELAQQCNISEVYFRKLFTEQFGMTPKQFIIDIRMNKAKQLLSEGSLKVCAVSEQCRFSNPYHFCRTFKAYTGMTPTEYIVKNRVRTL